MPLSENTKRGILNLLQTTILNKLKSYKPETIPMPFHYRLLGKDRYAMFSFIHSMNTTFGMSIFEQVGEIIANGSTMKAQRHYKLLGTINKEAEDTITKIHFELRKGKRDASYQRELGEIRAKIKNGPAQEDPDSTVDLFVIDKQRIEHYFDITSAKPNMKEFATLKLKLLRWSALRLSQGTKAKLITHLAIPYNPYQPEPYDRWTLKGLYDLNTEILVGEEFWNFLGNGNIYQELLDVFEETGKKLRDPIDKYFSRFGRGKE